LVAGFGVANPVVSTDQQSLQVSRYVTLAAVASDTQKDPLSALIPKLVFGHQVSTVQDALQVLLSDSGYRISSYHPDPRVHQLFNLSLPAVHRRMGPISLENALNTLAGSPWMLVVDPVNRLITFQLPRHYKTPRVYTLPQVVPVRYLPAVNSDAQITQQPVSVRAKQRITKRPLTKKQQVKNYRNGLKNFLDQSLQSTQHQVSDSEDRLLLERVSEVLK
jgi:conjugative transfer region protein (TIGR03748 family)